MLRLVVTSNCLTVRLNVLPFDLYITTSTGFCIKTLGWFCKAGDKEVNEANRHYISLNMEIKGFRQALGKSKTLGWIKRLGHFHHHKFKQFLGQTPGITIVNTLGEMPFSDLSHPLQRAQFLQSTPPSQEKTALKMILLQVKKIDVQSMKNMTKIYFFSHSKVHFWGVFPSTNL